MTTLSHSFFINLQEQEPGYIIDEQIFKNEVDSISKSIDLLNSKYKINDVGIHSILINILSFINYINENLNDISKQLEVSILLFKLLDTLPVKTFISKHKKILISIYNDMNKQVNKYHRIVYSGEDVYLINTYKELYYLLYSFYKKHLSIINV
jgi:hypothetical protein